VIYSSSLATLPVIWVRCQCQGLSKAYILGICVPNALTAESVYVWPVRVSSLPLCFVKIVRILRVLLAVDSWQAIATKRTCQEN